MIVSLLFSFIGIGVILIVLVLANKIYNNMLIAVELVDAGTNDDHIASSAINSSYKISPFESFYHEGKRIDPKKYIIRKVDGDCMSSRNIYAGDLLFIEKFNNHSDSLSIGDVLLN